jgi:hypothetical protein
MGWADHEPRGGWDAPEPKRVPGGIEVGGRFFSWSYLDVVPKAHVNKLIEQDRAAVKEQARRKTRKEAMEAQRLARLENLKRMTAEAPQWKRVRGEQWPKWHVFDKEKGHLVDTGAKLTDHGIEYPDGWIFPPGYEH